MGSEQLRILGLGLLATVGRPLHLIRALLGAPCWCCSHLSSSPWHGFCCCSVPSRRADGWMARRADGGSSWGARLDPLADKLMIGLPLIWLAAQHSCRSGRSGCCWRANC